MVDTRPSPRRSRLRAVVLILALIPLVGPASAVEIAEDSERPWTQPEIRTGTPFSDTLPWADTIEEAIERAHKERKLVLATVVAVQDKHWSSGFEGADEAWKKEDPPTFDDDFAMKKEPGLVKERAMMAALFTDPEVAHLVREHFVPVRLRLFIWHFDPRGPDVTVDPLVRLGTDSEEAIGPALVFATADGKPVHICRRMGVFSVPMARAMLRAVLARSGTKIIEPPPRLAPSTLDRAWRDARGGRLLRAAQRLETIPKRDMRACWEVAYLHGYLLDRLGDAAAAAEQWRRAADGDPTGPWGSRAALCLAKYGVRLENWETVRDFPFDPLAGTTEVGAGEAPLAEVMETAVDILLLGQAPDGGWKDPLGQNLAPSYDCSVPRTGLVVDALLGMRRRLPRKRTKIDAAIGRGVVYVGRFADAPLPKIWQITYALHLQAALLDANYGDRAVARRRAKRLIAELAGIQQEGGWSYVAAPRVHSFNTAPVLLLLEQLRKHGVKAPKGMAEKAAKFLESLRTKEDPRNFHYAKTMPFPVRASSCRTALCELALAMHAGKTDPRRVRQAVDLLFEHDDLVHTTTKVFESFFSISALQDAYHYYFGHYYTARALALLPEAEARRYAKKQIEVVLSRREVDGSFVDAQMFGRHYGTAMALLTLLEDVRYTR
jgi:hypothetical protein